MNALRRCSPSAFSVTQTFAAPIFHHFIDSESLFPAKFLIEEVRIMNNFRHDQYLGGENAAPLQYVVIALETSGPTMVEREFDYTEKGDDRWRGWGS